VKFSVIDKKKTGKESAKIIDEISNASKAGKTKPTRVQRNARFRIAFLVLLTLPIIGAVIFLTLRQSELEKILKEVLSNNKELTINIQNRDAQYQKLELELGGFRAQRNDQDLELQEIKAELRTQFDASVITLENEALMRIAALEAKNQDLRSDIVEVGARQAMRGGDSTDLRVLYQTEYILKLTEIKLNFDRDVGSAIELLESAVSLLSTSGSETLLPIREVLGEKIIQLSALPVVDAEEVRIKLFSLSRRIDALSVFDFAKFRQETQSDGVFEVFSKNNLSSEKWNSFIELLGEVFVWRQHNSKVIQEGEGLNGVLDDRRHVNLLLREANIALSSRNDALFQLCILKMLDWFERSVLLDTKQIQAILRDIQSLQDIQLRPNLPNIRQESDLTAQLIVELQL
tara:strand:- start:1148 stop:2356 length:1209 start_codon:yes stop_codon:yes gene_type:complete